jgi:hypothetical protein
MVVRQLKASSDENGRPVVESATKTVASQTITSDFITKTNAMLFWA